MTGRDKMLAGLFRNYWDAIDRQDVKAINSIILNVTSDYTDGQLPSDVCDLIDEINALQMSTNDPKEIVLAYYKGLSLLPKVAA